VWNRRRRCWTCCAIARFDADRPHVFLYGEEDTASTITFGQLFERAEVIAHELARRGMSTGHTVAIMLPTSVGFFYSFFGVLLAGGIPVPIYPPFRADRIEEYAARQSGILRNAQARLLITFRRAEAVARLLMPQVPSLKGVVNAERLLEAAPHAAREAAPGAGPLLLHQPRESAIAFLQYTSGSTGSPKGVILTHANLLANIRAIGEAAAMGPEDVGVTWLPLYHDMGLIGTWLAPLYFGFPIAVYSPLAFLTRAERWLRAIHVHRGTLTAAPNFAYELCVRKIRDAHIEGLDLSSMRAMLNGAEPVGPETLDRFAARFARYGLRREALTPVYGLAESALAVTVPPLGRGPLVDHIEREIFERDGRAVPAPLAHGDHRVISFVAVGRALPRHEVRIVDASGRDAGLLP
jgi:acyl-CoA synthetase (AMP-forming)/AMP-acid ligase II